MGETMMRRGGLTADEERAIQQSARSLETFVAIVYGGELRPPGDEWGDVDIPGVGVVDVKRVPTPRARFVNGGNYRPVSLAVVASAAPRLVLGIVEPEQWELGIPDVPGRRPQRCWHVRRAECFPPPPSWIRIGCVDPDWYAKSDNDLLHADWNDRNRRRGERRRATPEPMPWADPESVARGTGLASRRGHAPGRDNYKRKRR